MTSSAPPTITTAPLVNRAIPSVLDPGDMREEHNSGFIEEDLQTGTITERWTIQGNPWEARQGPGMQNLQIKNIHAWFGDHANNQYAYLIKRRFEHLAKSEDSDERKSLATFVWQIRPCPQAYEDEEVGALVSRQLWWSLDNPPQRVGVGESGWAVMVPSRLLVRRYPAVQLTRASIESIMAELGHTNGQNFAGKEVGFWLFQNMRRKMLWGNAITLDGTYEITLFFLGDPERHHEYWTPKRLRLGVLGPRPLSNSFQDLQDAHNPKTIHPQSSGDWENLIDLSAVIAECFPPA